MTLKRKTPLRSRIALKAKTGLKPRGVTSIERMLGEGAVKKASSISTKPRKKMNKKGKDEWSRAVNAADAAFSRYQRLTYADIWGCLSCFICMKRVHWKEAHLMHVFTRQKMSVRFHGYNKPGCEACNMRPLGDRKSYLLRLEDYAGPEALQDFIDLANEPTKYASDELWRMADEWAKEAQQLESRL